MQKKKKKERRERKKGKDSDSGDILMTEIVFTMMRLRQTYT